MLKGGVRVLNRVVMEGLTEKVTSEQSPGVGKGVKSFQVEEAAEQRSREEHVWCVGQGSKEAGSPGRVGDKVTGAKRACVGAL